jgi:spore germination cell wall hydrolase CwlJ-like protein
MPAGYVSAQEKIRQLDCLTRNIYWEAASEPFEGKVAVAQVTMNRVQDGRFAEKRFLRKSNLSVQLGL